MKLLLVEDHPAMQTTLQRSFERRGIQVTLCGDGANALERWRAALPDVVLLDLNLPGLDGLSVLAAARAEGLATPDIIVTARGAVGDRILGLNTGADDYLAKPFDLMSSKPACAHWPGAAGTRDTPAFCGLVTDADSGAVYFHGRPMELSSREGAMLRALLARPGHAVSNEWLLELVFPGQADGQAEAVEVVAYRLRKKLRATATQLITLRGLGCLPQAAP